MACTSERSREIGDFVNGRLDAEAGLALLDHVEECAACSEELDVGAELVAAAERHGSRLFRVPTPALDWRVPVAIAATLLVTLGLWVMFAAPKEKGLAGLAVLDPPPVIEQSLRGDEPDRGPEWSEAMRAYAAGDFAGAARRLAAIDRGDDPLLALYLGTSRLASGDTTGALPPLRLAAAHGDGLVHERGLWYLAQANLLLDDEQRARDRLKELVALEGDYELNARDLLEALDRR